MSIDADSLHDLLSEAVARHRVPGATLAVLDGTDVTVAATGVLHRGTGVQATSDSLFQIGSITKVWTATLLAQLVAEGRIEFGTPVAEVLPEFRVADPDVSAAVTVHHLLTHTSGIESDVFTDTGRGDDCVACYVTGCANVGQVHPLGATLSYCNTGFVIAGRLVEVLTGQVWDVALGERLIEPLRLTHTVTLPEDVLRFRAAMGHLADPGEQPEPAPQWSLPRSIGPAGLICASAGDLIEFARMHLRGGRGPQGEEILRGDLAAEMQRIHAEVPNPQWRCDHWGLGWFLCDWDGATAYGHDGETIGQYAFLRIDPDHGVAVALLTNGGDATAAYAELFGRLFADLCGVGVPSFAPPRDPPSLDGAAHVGTYERHGTRIMITATTDGLVCRTESTEELAGLYPAVQYELVPVREDLYAARDKGHELWEAIRFYQLDGGQRYIHFAGYATPMIATGSAKGWDRERAGRSGRRSG
jgi:CubicO group peptidase (beta-lactamase class C family)